VTDKIDCTRDLFALINIAIGIAIDTLATDPPKVLVARRRADAIRGGLWEFPGGKVEPTESGAQALARELAEELGVEVLDSEPLMQVEHDYGDKSVLLDIYRVNRWTNEPRGCEGQPLAWVMPEALDDYAFPAANQPIVLRLQGAGA